MKQKVLAYCNCAHGHFHEYKNYVPYKISSDTSMGTIMADYNKYTSTYDVSRANNERFWCCCLSTASSGCIPSQNEGWSFNLVHAWLKLHQTPKWIDLVASLKKQAKSGKKSR
jgi:hypothetical protein